MCKFYECVCKSFFEWSSNSLRCAAAKLQTQHCCTSTRSTYVYRDWFSFGWPLRRCQVTLVHRDTQVAARSVGCIRCVRSLDVGMWKRGWPKCAKAISLKNDSWPIYEHNKSDKPHTPVSRTQTSCHLNIIKQIWRQSLQKSMRKLNVVFIKISRVNSGWFWLCFGPI